MFAYDKSGRLTQTSNSLVQVDLGYDGMGRLDSETHTFAGTATPYVVDFAYNMGPAAWTQTAHRVIPPRRPVGFCRRSGARAGASISAIRMPSRTTAIHPARRRPEPVDASAGPRNGTMLLWSHFPTTQFGSVHALAGRPAYALGFKRQVKASRMMPARVHARMIAMTTDHACDVPRAGSRCCRIQPKPLPWAARPR